MQYLIDQARADLWAARTNLVYSIASYRVSKMYLGIANRRDMNKAVKSHIMTELNKARGQLRRDIKAAQNALDWYESVKLGLLAEYRRSL